MLRRAFRLIPVGVREWIGDWFATSGNDRFKAEVIGQAECPLMVRWTILKFPFGMGKLMVHHFPPEVTDRDPHDHPSSFITLVLKGGYFNTEWEEYSDGFEVERIPTIEWLGRGAVRYRRADHMHVTETGEQGAWTVVLMGPKIRDWGFRRIEDGSWWQFEAYIRRFGGVVRCDAPPDTMGQPAYRDYKGTHPNP